jgi:hypothetical protein
MAELNQRQIAHRRAMLAHMAQTARRQESRFTGGYRGNAWARVTPSITVTRGQEASGSTIVPFAKYAHGTTAPERQPALPY